MIRRGRTLTRGVGILGVCRAPGIAHHTEVRSMDQLIPSLAILVELFRDCFHPSVFSTFQALLAGWIICLGPRTISEVWQATGWAARRHHDTAYAVFRSAAWEWDDLGIVLATLILSHLIPGGVIWIVVDDTLCHKRGAPSFGRSCRTFRATMRPVRSRHGTISPSDPLSVR